MNNLYHNYNIPEIRIIPMSSRLLEFSGMNITDVQDKFFKDELPKREHTGYYCKTNIKTQKNTLLLFQYNGMIVASAILIDKICLPTPTIDGNKYILALDKDSIEIFSPISIDEITKIDSNIGIFSQAKQFLNINSLEKLIRLIENKKLLYQDSNSSESKMFSSVFEQELKLPFTQYFILDTKSSENASIYKDVDFQYYYWGIDKFNKVREGDLFIYRRPKSSSKINQFYFFGAGKIEKIEKITNTLVRGTISHAVVFDNLILQNDLNDFEFVYKERKNTWEHFFNQYGMNKIDKQDFLNLINLTMNDYKVNKDKDDTKEEKSLEPLLYSNMNTGNYMVEDKIANTKTRGAGQKVFAEEVKLNYNYICAITGISSRDFLVASHIIPWSEDKDNRLNPANGICLSVLVDKAFDKGYLSISDDYTIIFSKKLNEDVILYESLRQYEGKKIFITKNYPPNKEFLKWHREHLFKENKN